MGPFIFDGQQARLHRYTARLATFVAEVSDWKMAGLSLAGLSQTELEAIQSHSLNEGLETFRATFKSKYFKGGNKRDRLLTGSSLRHRHLIEVGRVAHNFSNITNERLENQTQSLV